MIGWLICDGEIQYRCHRSKQAQGGFDEAADRMWNEDAAMRRCGAMVFAQQNNELNLQIQIAYRNTVAHYIMHKPFLSDCLIAPLFCPPRQPWCFAPGVVYLTVLYGSFVLILVKQEWSLSPLGLLAELPGDWRIPLAPHKCLAMRKQ